VWRRKKKHENPQIPHWAKNFPERKKTKAHFTQIRNHELIWKILEKAK